MSQQPVPPPPMSDFAGSLWKGAAIIAATRLGLFKVLADGPRSTAEIAQATGASEAGIARLVEALSSFGYLLRVNERFANGPTPQTWLTPQGRVDFTAGVLWQAEIWHWLEGLSQAVQQGGPQRGIWRQMEDRPEMGQLFAQYMKGLAQLTADPLLQSVPLPDGARRMLDLGGSHGLRSIAYCERYSQLQAVVYDLPSALTDTQQTIAAREMGSRVSIQQGNCLAEDIGWGYDVILCIGLLHNFTEEENKGLARKLARALNPGGLIVIHEFLRNEPPDEFNAGFSLVLLLEGGTRTYSYHEIGSWLTDAEFTQLKRMDLGSSGDGSIITAVKGE